MTFNKNIPNVITMLRILIVPFILYAIFEKYFLVAMLLFAIGALSDFLDGYIARNFNLVSKFGKYIDPIADKILILSVLVALSVIEKSGEFIHMWMVLLIFTREILITLVRSFLKKRSMDFEAKFLGKAKTMLQVLIIAISLLLLKYFPESVYMIEYFMIIFVIVTCYSGFRYMDNYIRLLKNES